MDSRRPAYAAHPPHHQPPPQYAYPPHTPVEQRPPLPHYPQSHPNNITPQAHQPYPFAHPPQHHPPPPQAQHIPGPPGSQGLALPPIYSGAQQIGHSLPPVSYPSHQQPPPPHDARDGPEYHTYNNHNRSGHATPAPVNRSYSHDSTHQRTPTTPAHPGPGPYPPLSAPDGAQQGPPLSSQPMDHGGHHGYPPPNGVPHGLPPAPPPPPGPPQHHALPPSHYATPVMEHHSYQPGPQPTDVYYGQNYGPASNSQYNIQKKKQMRATQACEQCRSRKQKCDEGNPCSFCKENNLSCQYRDTPPAKVDKNMERVLSYLESQTSGLMDIRTMMDDLNRRLQGLERNGTLLQGAEPEPGPANEPTQQILQPEPARQMPELEDHRTAPHKLILLWPSVKPLFKDAHVEVNDSYVMEAEDRGILRIWTCAEGIDEYDGTQPGGPASPAASEDSGDMNMNTPSPPHNLWGSGFAYTPPSEISRSEQNLAGGLKPDGTLDLDVSTLNTLYDSYMRHIHIMHPLLDKQKVRKIFDTFIKRYSTGPPALRHKFAVANHPEERPLKRQRSNGSSAPGVMQHDNHIWRREPTERSPMNAIVWLILALGKICLHKGPLPALASDKSGARANAAILHTLTGNSGLTSSSPMSITIKHNENSPTSTPMAQPTPPGGVGLAAMGVHSRRPSLEGTSTTRPRNLDVVPGLAYYAKAAEILGDQGDGNDLIHAQMFLLAGLYKGQLARVKESMSWFNMAGRAIRMLLDRYKLYNDHYWDAHTDIHMRHERGQKRIKDKRSNLIVLASWTCLQLESDILAEMRLPSSGVGGLEHMLLMPHEMPDDGENYEGLHSQDNHTPGSDANNLIYYSAQMFLRKRLNEVHKEMYGDQCLDQTVEQVKGMLSGHEDFIGKWRGFLPEALQWKDDDPPASDILTARLRAKYYGARYIINRPFLDYALHIMGRVDEAGPERYHSIESVAKDRNGNPRDKAEIHLFTAIRAMGRTEIWAAVERCVEAAMQSTVAFDNVPERLIVTNIHGTAHAQFGNMLVLAATYYNKWCKTFVKAEKFAPLLLRTIKFLRQFAPISPTCAIDCVILEKINRLLFGVPDEERHVYKNEMEPPSATTSFSHST